MRTKAMWLAALLVLAVGCGSGDQQAVRAGDEGAAVSPTTTVAGPAATVRVQLEPTDGVYVEGFEVGLRFEGTGGEVIASTLWSDVVTSTGATGIEGYYDAVLDQPVPAGSVTLAAQVTIGQGPPPSIPDLAGDLPCRLDLEVGAGRTVTVEVSFDEGAGCLRLVDEPPTGTTTEPLPTVTSTTAAAVPGPTSTTTSEMSEPAGPAATALPVGSEHAVDVDLDCAAFVLGGTWVLVDGDPRSWQPPPEPHEGGAFTIDTPTTGTFRGDAAGTKVATFRLLPPGEELGCVPRPRR